MPNQRDLNEPGSDFDLVDLPVPSGSKGGAYVTQTGRVLPPAQQIAGYSSDDWEEFILEWALELRTQFHQVKKMGGPGDRGIDIAAFKTRDGFEGPWICYQAKHYGKALTLSDALPEMLKIFYFALDEHYVLPEEYCFMAPKGCGASLNRKLSSPSHLRDWFLGEIDRKAPACVAYQNDSLQEIQALATSTDFSMFRSVELHEMLQQHERTRYYSARFGCPLPQRPPTQGAPSDQAQDETVYVRKLLDVYRELDPVNCRDYSAVSVHRKYGSHLQRQREAFYSAEALRRYARDSVPEGTFEELQNEIFEGVIDTAESSYETGMERLQAVMKQSGQLSLDNLVLIAVTRLLDRKGICHQLANDDRLTWMG